MRNQPLYEYKNCKVGQVYDMGDNSIGKVTHSYRNGSANILVISGPGKGLNWCVNGQSTSVYKLIKDI